jgi:hypothetical protein
VCPLLHGYFCYVRRFVNHPPSTDVTQYHAIENKYRKHTTTAVRRNKSSHTTKKPRSKSKKKNRKYEVPTEERIGFKEVEQ